MRQTGPGSREHMGMQLRRGKHGEVLQRVRQTETGPGGRVDLQLRRGEHREVLQRMRQTETIEREPSAGTRIQPENLYGDDNLQMP